ncbi:MAG TPA: 23S rRNA (adenine(2503)-C(2))-methyltransferase RlmN [Phycisphaerae bacterium]|nr:23S rRNA (adenine(2503)-C(2))-methyltransferase RlmN [Phycisphaerae bacterium]
MKTHVLSLTLEELGERLGELGMAKFRAKQVMEWVYQKRAATFEEMTNLSKGDRAVLGEHFEIFTSAVQRDLVAPDATQKLLLRWPEEAGGANGGGLTECVMIPCDDDQCDAYGNTAVTHRRTACLSTQVGCPVGCAFCASGMEGLQGNLTVGQVVEEALRLTHKLPREGAGHRLTNIVFMGMGEPLANYAVTVAAVKVLMAPWAFHISGRKITVSTVGLPPQMKRLAEEGLPVTLAISLHAPNDALRKQIIPWAKKISIEQIVEAGKYYFEKTGREVTLEYIMLEGERGGVNTLPEHARELAGVAKKLRANVNLIYYNEVPDLGFKRPSGQVVFGFQNVLRSAGVNVHVRRSRGREIAAACGQLARQDRASAALTVNGR